MISIDDIELEYDNRGRIKYNPLLHTNNGTPWSEEDKEYLCKYHKIDKLKTLAFALDRTATTVSTKVREMQMNGEYEHYRNLNKYW